MANSPSRKKITACVFVIKNMVAISIKETGSDVALLVDYVSLC